MLDRFAIPVCEKALAPFGAGLAKAKVTPEILLMASFAFALAAALLAGTELFLTALAAFGISRLLDGLAEAGAKAGGITGFGRYLDISLNFTGFAAIPLGFAFAAESNGLIAAILVFSILALGAAELAYAGIARGMQKKTDQSGFLLFDTGAGLIGTTEVTMAYILMFLLPDFFAAIAILLSLAALAAAAFRVLKARMVFME